MFERYLFSFGVFVRTNKCIIIIHVKKIKLYIHVDWLVLTVNSYFMPKGQGIVYIICLYLHLLCSCFLNLLYILLYGFKYFLLILIIYTQLYDFRKLIIIILSKKLWVIINNTNNLHTYRDSQGNYVHCTFKFIIFV